MSGGGSLTAISSEANGLMTLDRDVLAKETTRALVVRAQAGDSEAFDELMVIHQRQVLNTAWRLLGQLEDAKDAAQEVFLKLYRFLPRVEGDRDLEAWLYRVTVNVCRDAARRRARRGASSLDSESDGVEDLVEAGISPHDLADQRERSRIVQSLLLRLSRKERAALVLRDVEGLSTEETARILGSSPSTIRSQISSGRSKLRQLCERVFRGKP